MSSFKRALIKQHPLNKAIKRLAAATTFMQRR